MSVNRLNLQIGGPGPEEYNKRKVMRELRGNIDEQVDAYVEDFLAEDQRLSELPPPPPPVLTESVEPERVLTRQERMAESISRYHEKTNQTLSEVSPVSDSERIRLLEDAFAQMKRGQPQTLVSGIGASLDSGGGAVWLWDLNDVDIGTPMDGVYPSIANGSLLKYNSTLKVWEAGPADDATVQLNTAQIDLTNPQGDPDLIDQASDIPGYSPLGTLLTQLDWNKKTYDYFNESLPLKGGTICADADINIGAEDGILIIRATDTSDGRLILQNSSGEEKITLNGHLGQGVFTASCNAAAFTSTSDGGTSTFKKTNFTDLVNFQTDVQVSGGKELSLNRGNSNTSTGGLVIKGISSASAVQSTPTISEILSVSYGSATTSSSGDPDTINYTGGTSGSNSLQTKSSVQSLINVGGGGVSFSFQGTCNVTIATTANSPAIEEEEGYFYINETAGVADATWTGIAGFTISANQLIIWSEANSRWFAGAVEDDTSFLKINGTNEMEAKLKVSLPPSSDNTAFSVRPAGGDESFVVFSGGSVNMDGTLTVGSNIIPENTGVGNLGTSSNNFSQVNATTGNFDHITTDNQSTMANISPTGNGTVFLGGDSNRWNAYLYDLHVTNVSESLVPGVDDDNVDLGSSTRPFINAYVNKLSTLGSAASTFNGGFQSKSTSTITTTDGTNKMLEVIPNNARIRFGYPKATGNGDTSGTGVNANYYFDGGNFMTTVIGRGSDNGNANKPQVVIKGKTVDGGDSKANNLLEIWRTTGASPDVIKYYGNTTADDNNIQTKGSVTSLMAKSWTNIPGGSIPTDWTTKTKKYRVSNGGNQIDIYFELICTGGTTSMTANIFLGTLDSAYRPATDVAAVAVAYSNSTTAVPLTGVPPLLVTIIKTGQLYVWAPDGSSLSGLGTIRARFSYPMGA